MQDGNTMRNNYGCDLDSLTTGSRIGMMRSASGDLHYYINGVDQGVACSGLPSGRKLYELEDLTEATHTTTTSSKSATLSPLHIQTIHTCFCCLSFCHRVEMDYGKGVRLTDVCV